MIIDGRALAQDLNLRTQQRINNLQSRPLLVDVVVGNDDAVVLGGLHDEPGPAAGHLADHHNADLVL